MPFPEVDTAFVMIAWMVQCAGLAVFFVIIAGGRLAKAGKAERDQQPDSARRLPPSEAERRLADGCDAHR